MISIITAIHNQIDMNKIFFEYLKKNTKNEFELIIIDNKSTDKSADFFEKNNAKVIRNDANYSYPYSQNQGISASSGEYLFFLNNDIVVGKDWDEVLIQSMEKNELEVVTSCGVEKVETETQTKKLKRRWKRIKNILSLFGTHEKNLRRMHKIMYKNWDHFISERKTNFKGKVIEGFVGNTVVIKKTALDKIGLWDERIQGGDFDLSMRVKKRSIEVGDIKPIHIALDAFNHHYIRLTIKTKFPPFKDKENLISLEEKWGEENIAKYL
ncbi:glycosyltransferase family 2 protein [Marinomonas balearica]|uniref:GT2 family glycosyltransferase n=1 Tax=Marinomonas balearica TaxID=491947 RepID=A0A4R6MBA9_9GAMM|nr:glycosyltransferase [Marinomonas balearica]TDO98773.1 GT2 family glycosyltransferase [Marinomonas balearica]